MFLGIVAYVLGIFMEAIIPRRGILRYLNPVSRHGCILVLVIFNFYHYSIPLTKRKMPLLLSWLAQLRILPSEPKC
jgi:hypothetical protein